MKLASHLWQSPHGIYYFRYSRGYTDIKRSLRTKDPARARQLAYAFGAAMIDPEKLLEKLQSGETKEWTVRQTNADGSILEIQTDGTEEDHRRALEALILALPTREQLASQSSTQSQLKTDELWILETCIEDYMHDREGEFSPGTVRTYRSSFKKLMEGLGRARPIQQIDSTLFVKFRKQMDKIAHPDTIVRDCGAYRGLFDWAIRRGRYQGQNPIENAKFTRSQRARVVADRETPHNPLDAADLSKIFDKGRYAAIVKPCAYWLPVLALFTGARLGELCNLKLADVISHGDGTWFLKITDSKTVNGIREIPLHSSIIDAGLIHYMEDVKQVWPDAELLFPYLRPASKNGYANLPGRDFSSMKTELGLGSEKVFHSFRKTIISCLQYNGCPPEFRKAFVGHEAGDSNDVHTVYSVATLDPARLREVIFPHLDFTKWPVFSMPSLKYEVGRFDDYLAKMKRKQAIDEARAGREARVKPKHPSA